MTLTELQYIVILAQEHHFGRAADRAFVTQPALSLAIKKLEDELGVAIFERRKNHVALTPLGEQIVHQAQRVLEEADQIKLLAAQGKNQLMGALRFGVIATVGPYLLPDLIPILHKRAPAMPLEIEENLTVNLTAMLKSGKLDVIMIALPYEEHWRSALPTGCLRSRTRSTRSSARKLALPSCGVTPARPPWPPRR